VSRFLLVVIYCCWLAQRCSAVRSTCTIQQASSIRTRTGGRAGQQARQPSMRAGRPPRGRGDQAMAVRMHPCMALTRPAHADGAWREHRTGAGSPAVRRCTSWMPATAAGLSCANTVCVRTYGAAAARRDACTQQLLRRCSYIRTRGYYRTRAYTNVYACCRHVIDRPAENRRQGIDRVCL
jgi:hypothetical protein